MAIVVFQGQVGRPELIHLEAMEEPSPGGTRGRALIRPRLNIKLAAPLPPRVSWREIINRAE
jgi:hypothetical protein